jgi:CheY-specific phosphatase CheX
MSSLMLRHVPTPEEHMAPLTTAFFEVVESSFFTMAEPCDAAQFAELLEATPGSWLRARVSFTGAFAGTVTVAVPDGLGSELLMAFMGDPDADATTDAVFDAIGELTNMACGDWLTHVSGRRRFDLAPPAVERMAPAWRPAVIAAPEGGVAPQTLLTVSGMPVALGVAFQVA